MKRLFICYSLEPAFLTQLELRLTQITLGAADQNDLPPIYVPTVMRV